MVHMIIQMNRKIVINVTNLSVITSIVFRLTMCAMVRTHVAIILTKLTVIRDVNQVKIEYFTIIKGSLIKTTN